MKIKLLAVFLLLGFGVHIIPMCMQEEKSRFCFRQQERVMTSNVTFIESGVYNNVTIINMGAYLELQRNMYLNAQFAPCNQFRIEEINKMLLKSKSIRR